MSFTRREFVAAGAAAVSYAGFAGAETIGANDRLRIGVIGCGGQATGHMRALVKMRESDKCDVTAVCDVFDLRAQKAAQLTGGKIVKDYRRVLDDKDIDYVLIATPEHWHHQMTIEAIAAGKHIYVEKPMTQTIEQSKHVIEKLKASPKTKLQVGVQGMSDESYEVAHKYIQDGVLGKVVLSQIDYSRNHQGDFWAYPMDEDAKPGENLDWKAWLGPAPKRPWDPERFFRWRRYWDYSGGIATDLFIHRVTRILKATGATLPLYGTGTGGKFEFSKSIAEIPDTLNILLDYPEGMTIQLISTMANDTKVDHLIRGHKATLEFTRTGFTIKPQKLFADDAKEITYEKTGAEDLTLHHRNFMNAIRKGEALKCDSQLGYYGVVACEMGNTSYRKRKYLKWDAAKERLINA
jgi:predicted dehydrogenase